ncbi:MAG TPA: MBOAT family protein [Mucilaginibacter sp.]|jgi:alginate O-acetyltransferase complex protein AlgI|nr:MBOAT family protein [Mucilaginibacter sp.]
MNLVLVFTGFLVIKKKKILLGWGMFVISILAVYLLFQHQNPVIKMLAIIATTFTGMKIIVVPMEYRDKPVRLNFKQWAAFAGGWVGMRAQPFETLGGDPLPGARQILMFGISRLVVGGLIILAAREIVWLPLNAGFIHVIVSVLLLVGFSFVLHFGLLSISAGIWRHSGANTYLLFRQPAKAISLTEFWGKRWNLAFSEMTSIAIFRPLRGKVGPAAALMLAFIFSGILHELALSLPVNRGCGLPTLYFIIQGGMVLLEKILREKGVNFLQNKLFAHVWVFFWIVAPAPLLFHAEFIKQIIWPMAGLKF